MKESGFLERRVRLLLHTMVSSAVRTNVGRSTLHKTILPPSRMSKFLNLMTS